MRTALAAALVFLALCDGASAQRVSSWGGYDFPNGSAGTADGVCAPLCTSMSAEWIVSIPTYSGSGGSENVLQWIGIQGNFTTNSDSQHCPGYQCLFQGGTRSAVTTGGVQTYDAWWELFCPTAPTAPCTNIKGPVTGLTINGGDHIKATMACISGCTPAYSASAEWSLSLTDVTTGVTCNMTPAKTCGTPCTTGAEASCFNAPIGQALAAFATESNIDIPLFAPAPWANLTINGSPVVWADIIRAASFQNTTARTMYPSQLIGGGNAFYLCRAAGTYSSSADFCAAGASKGTAGLGVQ